MASSKKNPGTITKPPTPAKFPHAFPKLTKAQVRELEKFGEYKSYSKGEVIWEAGTPNVCMFVIDKGRLCIRDGNQGVILATHKPGNFSGDIDVINRRPTFTSAFAETDVRLLVVGGDCVRSIVSERPVIGEILMRAFLLRREILQGASGIGAKVIGSRFSSDTVRIREFLARSRYPQSLDDLEDHTDVHSFLQEFDVDESETPVVLLPNGKLLRVPTNLELGRELGITQVVDSVLYDLVVVGAGPGGLAAAVYGASEGLNTLVLDEDAPGGQAGSSSRIENYMGFPLGVTGQVLTDSAVNQAEKFGARLVAPARVTSMTCEQNGIHNLVVEGVGNVSTKCVILAPGASYRKLEVEDLDEYVNAGVYYSATYIERVYCSDNVAIVVGGGNSAGQAAVYMSQMASKVHLVVRSGDLRKDMSSYLARRIESSDKIQLRLNSQVCSLQGEGRLATATIVDHVEGTHETIDAAGIFVMIGAIPHTDWIPPQIAKDSKGFILTGQDLKTNKVWGQTRDPYFLETSCPGIFAVGDARSGSIKRVASAVGEGSMAVALIHQFLSL